MNMLSLCSPSVIISASQSSAACITQELVGETASDTVQCRKRTRAAAPPPAAPRARTLRAEMSPRRASQPPCSRRPTAGASAAGTAFQSSTDQQQRSSGGRLIPTALFWLFVHAGGSAMPPEIYRCTSHRQVGGAANKGAAEEMDNSVGPAARRPHEGPIDAKGVWLRC